MRVGMRMNDEMNGNRNRNGNEIWQRTKNDMNRNGNEMGMAME